MSEAWSGGSDSRWRAFRASILAGNPHCAIGGPKCTKLATQADHIVPLVMGGAKYDPLNCRPACAPCNQGRRIAAPEPVHWVSVSTW